MVDFVQLALMVLHQVPKSYIGFVMTVTKPMTFEELGPLLFQEEAHENTYNQSNEKALTMKDKGKGTLKDSQP